MSTIGEEVADLMSAISAGDVKLTSEVEPQAVFAGVVEYLCHHDGKYDGVKLSIFNDANEWDYIDGVVFTDGRIACHHDIYGGVASSPSRPSDKEAWRCYGIPGYLRFRRKTWSGFVGKRSDENLARNLSRREREGSLLHKTLMRLLRATSAVPNGEDPTEKRAVKAALREWHSYACPTLKDTFHDIHAKEG